MLKLITRSFLIVPILFICSCSSKKILSEFNIDKMHELSIVNTRKAQIVNENSKIIIIATYLNPIKASFLNEKEENFIVGVYVDKHSKKSDINPFYKITLNSDSEIDTIKRIKQDSKYMKMIPLVNKWADYYMIEFPKKDTKNLVLSFEADSGAKAILTFEKDF